MHHRATKSFPRLSLFSRIFLYISTRRKKLRVSGGGAQNSRLNGRVWKSRPLKGKTLKGSGPCRIGGDTRIFQIDSTRRAYVEIFTVHRLRCGTTPRKGKTESGRPTRFPAVYLLTDVYRESRRRVAVSTGRGEARFSFKYLRQGDEEGKKRKSGERGREGAEEWGERREKSGATRILCLCAFSSINTQQVPTFIFSGKC